MRAIAVLALLGCAGLWAWALWYPKEAPPVPPELVGEYRLYNFEPPEGVTMSNPFKRGQVWYYTLRADGSYLLRIELPGGYELSRQEGRMEVDDRGTLTMTQVSANRRAEAAEPSVFYTRWLNRQTNPAVPGPRVKIRILALKHADQGFEYHLVARDRWDDLQKLLASG